MPQPNDTSAPASEPAVAGADFSPAMLLSDDDNGIEGEPSASTAEPSSGAAPVPPLSGAAVVGTPDAKPVVPAVAPGAGGAPSPLPPAAPNQPAAPVAAPAAPSWDPSQAAPVAAAAPVPAVAPTPSAVAPGAAPSNLPPDALKLRNDTMEAIAKEYTLSEDEAQQFLINPERVVPQMAARMHLQIYEDVVRFLVAQMPTIQMDLNGRQKAAEDAKNAFFTEFPQLKEHEADVVEAARLYRAQFPNTDMKKAIADIGSYVMYKKGLGAAMQAAPAAPAIVRPAVPAMGGGAGALPGGNSPTPNRWGELATQMEDEG